MEFTEENLKVNLEKYLIPENMHNGILNYIIDGTIPGSFLQAVLNNDLKGAIVNADDTNITRLIAYVNFFYNAAPGNCWGSKELVINWHIHGGLRHTNSQTRAEVIDRVDHDDGE
jgi:hypothetical protein